MTDTKARLIPYLDALLELHDLIAKGDDETKRGEELRDMLEDISKNLSKNENELLEGLSGDLYMLNKRDMYRATSDEEKKKLVEEFRECATDKVWDRMLEILRCNIGLPRATIAFFRGKAWETVHPRLAQRFFDYAEAIK